MPISSLARWRAVAAALAGTVALAAPAQAEPVKAGPAVPDELAVVAIGGALQTPANYRTDQAALHRISAADGAYRGRIVFPAEGDAALTLSTQTATQVLRNGALKRSVDGRHLTFTGVRAAAGLSFQDPIRSAAVRVAPDRTWTDTLYGTGFFTITGTLSVGSVTVDGSRYWTGSTNAQRPLGTIAPGDAATTQVAGQGTHTVTGVDIVDGSLYSTTTAGVSRLQGLPTVADTVTLPQPVITLSEAFDSIFLDTDATAGADTAYVTRGNRGLWKFALDGGAWAPRGFASGSYAWVTARAVAGAIELYATSRDNRRVLKLVDTAQSGAALATSGPATIALAPAGVRYTGLAFAPGSGFPADPAPYPATPPALYPSATSLDTSVQASPAASIALDVVDPNTPASELTVTATSSNTTVLPSDRITFSGTGARRTVSFDPVAAGTASVTLTVRAGEEQATATISVRASGVAPDPTSHYYSGAVDLSAAVDAGDGHFLAVSDEVNTIHLYKQGISGAPIASFSQGFPGGETDFEGAARFGDMIVWTASHGNNRGGSSRPERRFLAFTKVTGSGEGTDLEWSHSYTRLWQQWTDWDAANGHGLGANKLKFNTATVAGLIPNAPNGFNVEGVTMAPGSTSVAWFGMRAPTITGEDGIERALILPVNNIDKLTSEAVNAEFGAPILLDLGGRSIRDIAKNAADQYLITAGTGDTDDSLKNWALYMWDGNPAHDPQFVKELPTDEGAIGAWEGIATVPNPLVAGSRALLTADSGDTGLGKSYGQYVTLGEPVAGPAVVTGVTATGKPGAIGVTWEPAARATRYFVTVKTAAGQHAPGSPLFVTGTSASLEGLDAGTEYTVAVRAENVATRSAIGTAVKATPTQGPRTATTTTVRFDGDNVIGEAQKLIATVSEPGATGTVRFFDGASAVQNRFGQSAFPVVDGKAEVVITDQVSPGLRNFRATFTTANAETFLSSDSELVPTFISYRPRVPRAEIVEITGDRVAGGRVGIKVKLYGYTPGELYSAGQLATELSSRVNGAATKTRITSDGTASDYFDANGEVTIYTRALVAGEHRISGWVPNYAHGYISALTDEIPLTIAPAGSPAPEPRTIRRPVVVAAASGSRISTEPITLTARLSDPTLAGTVQFFYSRDTRIGNPIPVVDGVATYTGPLPSPLQQVYARFEPAADRGTTASAVSLGVPLLRHTAPLPFDPPTATATTLAIVGERTVGSPLRAEIAVAPAVAAPFAARDVNGHVEVLDRDRVLGIAEVVAGEAELDLGVLAPGPHTLQARYVTADALRSEPSASAAQTVDVLARAEAPVGADVPATLSLALGAPVSFGTFTPGVAREYTASTTATVISSAGAAALTVADPSATATGHLVNGSFALPRPLQGLGVVKTYAGPVANDVAAVEFKQAIAAGDALRTGAYSKTLTFTLSTSTP